MSIGINRKRRPKKLQTKLFAYYLIIPCLILVAFSVFFYTYVSGKLINKEIDSLSTVNDSFASQVDGSLKDLDFVSANINYNILKSGQLSGSEYEGDISRSTLADLTELFTTINGTDLKADQINYYKSSGTVIKVGLITKTEKTDMSSLDWYDDVLDLSGHKMISKPYNTNRYSAGSGAKKWYVSVYRTASPKDGSDKDVIETIKRCSVLFKSIISYTKSADVPASVYIFSESGALIYPYEIDDSSKTLLEKTYCKICMLDGKGDGEIHDPVSDVHARLVYNTSSYSGWTFITVQKDSVILAPVNHLQLLLMIIILLLLFISVLMSWSLSRNMIKPVKHLKHIVQRIQIDSLGEETPYDYNPSYEELGELYNEFQKMSISLKTSMNDLIESRQQEVKSRSMALQSQINPHFYYNTLACIMVLAENGRDDEVIKLCRTLSQIMRYISDNSSMTVTVADETEYVRKYLYCMKIRYQDSLNFDINIDEKIMNQPVPKLMIQPLVENAVKYGTDCNPPWKINITGQVTDKGWVVNISDTGNGFSKEAIEKLDLGIADADEHPGMPVMKIDGMGMINVYLRWKLFCKNDFIFKYGNNADGHAYVCIGRDKMIETGCDQ